MHWNENDLAALPTKHGFRLRGLEMTRLETFCDAAFAFAVTLLVISGDGIPTSVEQLTIALKGVPAFAASFAAIATFWNSHREWSRRFGLEDNVTILISLSLVFVMLVYVYPLKMVFSAMFYWMSGGFFPTSLVKIAGSELLDLFVIYGLGFAALSGLVALLHVRALRAAEALKLNAVEKMATRQEITLQLILTFTALASGAFAAFMPKSIAPFAGFVYMTLPISMPVTAMRLSRKVEALQLEEAKLESG